MATLGWQQSLFGGIFSLQTVHRRQKDQVTRGEIELDDGITIISQDNLGYVSLNFFNYITRVILNVLYLKLKNFKFTSKIKGVNIMAN